MGEKKMKCSNCMFAELADDDIAQGGKDWELFFCLRFPPSSVAAPDGTGELPMTRGRDWSGKFKTGHRQ